MTSATHEEARVHRSFDNYLQQLEITHQDAGADAAIELANAMIAAIMDFGLRHGMSLRMSATMISLTAMRLAERS